MIFKIAGGIGLILLSLPMIGFSQVPQVITGIALVIAGIALLAGI